MTKTCGTCANWTQFNAHHGECSAISAKLTANISYNDGGYLNAFETEEDFGCTLWRALAKGDDSPCV